VNQSAIYFTGKLVSCI